MMWSTKTSRFVSTFANRYPFGNVHMAHTPRPVIVENGADGNIEDVPRRTLSADSSTAITRELPLSAGLRRAYTRM